MEHNATLRNFKIKYSKISLKVRTIPYLEAAAACYISFRDRIVDIQGSQEASSQPFYGQAYRQKVQGARDFLRIQGGEGEKIRK